MKTKSVLLNPRVLASSSLGAIGILFALVAFIALPRHSALANLGYCNPPEFSSYYEGSYIAVEITSVTQDKNPCIVFYTTDQSTPAHSGANPISPTLRFYDDILIAPHQTVCFKAIGYRALYSDSDVVAECISNGNP